MFRVAKTLGNALLDTVIPRRCGLCGRFDTFLCPVCTADLSVAAPPRCPTCWGLRGARNDCRTCAAVLVQPLVGVRSP
ncbi:MAG: hypothetical protein ACRDJ9_34810, partial [Dehalococcoidia bacterium]